MALGAQVKRPENEGLKKLALGREQRRDGEACHAKEAVSGPSFLRVSVCYMLVVSNQEGVFNFSHCLFGILGDESVAFLL